MHKIAIVGASGFAGAELMRICAAHPGFDVSVVTGESAAGTAVGDLYPSLALAYPDTVFEEYSSDLISMADLTFVALPHGHSQRLMPEISEASKRVIDLGADHRFDDPAVYEAWYGEPHAHPETLSDFAFGIPELFRADLTGAAKVAVAGCYVTAASLALAPFLASGLVEPTGVVVDAASGVSGAGRGLKHETSFTSVSGDFTAYGLVGHRHTPEMEMVLESVAGSPTQLVFTPHLAPMSRGILATCYARTIGDLTDENALECLADFYRSEPFVRVSEALPTTKATTGTNTVHMSARVDPRTGWTIVLSALDNLVKGAAGQAVQCANLALGLDEGAGLTNTGLNP